LGEVDFVNIDTSNEVKLALNAGLRAVETDIPFTVADTLTVAAGTFAYTLNDNFRRPVDGMPSGYRVVMVYRRGTTNIFGVPEANIGEYGRVPFTAGLVASFSIQGATLWVSSDSPVGALLYVYGPGAGTSVSHGGSTLSGLPEVADRWAAVYWAAARLARSRERHDLSVDLLSQYLRIVSARTGQPGVGAVAQ